MLDAALETVRRDGFARTSARAIARTGNFNQALIFYHFGSVNDLLLAALDGISRERMLRYQEVLPEASGLVELARLARQLYLEDRACPATIDPCRLTSCLLGISRHCPFQAE